ncbi:MAG: class I SAM-dependent methyltransferase [Polyangiaceae bacterium]
MGEALLHSNRLAPIGLTSVDEEARFDLRREAGVATAAKSRHSAVGVRRAARAATSVGGRVQAFFGASDEGKEGQTECAARDEHQHDLHGTDAGVSGTDSNPTNGQSALNAVSLVSMSGQELRHEEIWRRYDDVEVRLTAQVSERMVELAGLCPGMRVLDVAAGRGEPAIRAARAVGPGGVVVGVELSPALLEMARGRAVAEGIVNVDWRVGDAQSMTEIPIEEGWFDAATARWGLMYMTDPVAALRGIRRALSASGVLVAALWAEPERVGYFSWPRRVFERYGEVPRLDPEAPGPFRFADMVRIQRDFEVAGFVVEHVEEMETAVFEAESAAEVVAWTRAMGMNRLLKELSEERQSAWEEEFGREMEGRRKDGVIRIGGVTRLMRARR